jgi:hypothetical protein
VPDGELVAAQIDVLDAHLTALLAPQPRARR